MPSQNRLNLLLPGGIGAAYKFKGVADPERFVRMQKKEGSLNGGLLLLRMTAQELFKVHKIVRKLGQDPDGLPDLEWEYDFLTGELEVLRRERKTTSVFNLIRQKQIRKEAGELFQVGSGLYISAKRTSNRAERDLLEFQLAKTRIEEAAEVAADEQVMGYSLDEPLESETASLVDIASYYTALDEPYTDSISLGDVDGHSPHGDIPDSGVVSSAKHMAPEASSVLAFRTDNPALPGGGVPGSGATLQDGTSSSPRTGNQTAPPPVPNSFEDNISNFGSHPGVQNNASMSSPTVPYPPIDLEQLADLVAKALNKPPSIHYHGDVYQHCINSPNATNPTLIKDGYQNNAKHMSTGNAAPDHEQAGLGGQGAAYPTPPRSSARNPWEPSPPLSGPPRHLSAFHDFGTNWDTIHDASQYTTIDGQKHGQGLQASHCIQTAEVLRETTKSHIIKIVQEFNGLSDSEKETCIKLVQDAPILPGLIAYIYTHLIICPPRSGENVKDDWSKGLSNLQTEVNYWRGKGGIQCVLFYKIVKSNLIEILVAVRTEQHTCNSALLDGTALIQQDIQNLAALAALCITGPDKDKILRAEESEAVVLANLFHALLDAGVELDDWCRRCLFDALISLTKVTGRCPPSLYLTEGTVSNLVPCDRGGFGIVSKGKIGSRVVAVKYLKRDDDKDLCKEAIVWRHLRHPNCLPLYGVYKNGPIVTTGLVSPWMHHGTLFSYLKSTPTANRTILILDMVRGLNYLHSMRPHVAHRDIKPDNILVTKQGRACLADFGLASVFDMDPQFRTATAQLKMIGTRSYTAPEIFTAETEEDNRKVNKRWSDMYSLGCTIYATYTGNPPFHDVRPELIPEIVVSHKRPPFPEGQILLEMWGFIQNLWGPEPSERLTAKGALAWMERRAGREGIDTSVPAFEEEWLWKGSQTGGPLSVACLT